MASSSIVASLNSTYIVTLRGHPIMIVAVTPQTRRVLLGVKMLETARGVPIIYRCKNYLYNGWFEKFSIVRQCQLGSCLPLSISHLYQDNLSDSKISSISATIKQNMILIFRNEYHNHAYIRICQSYNIEYR